MAPKFSWSFSSLSLLHVFLGDFSVPGQEPGCVRRGALVRHGWVHNLLSTAPGGTNPHFEKLHYSYFGCDGKQRLLSELPWVQQPHLKVEMVRDEMPDPRHQHLPEPCKVLPSLSFQLWGLFTHNPLQSWRDWVSWSSSNNLKVKSRFSAKSSPPGLP